MTRAFAVLVCMCLSIEIEAQQLMLQNLTTDLTAVSFCDTLLGWVVGQGSYKTTDGGMHWTMGPGGYYESISATPGGVVWTSWMSPSYSYVGRTITAGSNWDTVSSVYYNSISEFHFRRVLARDSLRAWVAYAGGWLADYVAAVKTIDGGRHWTDASPYHLHGSFTDIAFGRESAVALLGDQRFVFRTTDEAQHWHFDTLAALCNAVALNGTAQVWAVGNAGSIYHSRDTDSLFSVQQSGVSAGLNGVTALDSLTVWAVGDYGTLLETTNGGDVWVKVESGTNRNLTGVCFVDKDHGWIVGDSGVVLVYTRGNLSAVEYKPHGTLDEFLVQAYPNPFNSSVTLSIHSGVPQLVTVEVFDVLGRTVARVAQDLPIAGRIALKWNPGQCASGAYIIRTSHDGHVLYNRIVYLR